MLAVSLLAFLKNGAAHGYQLARRLADAGLPDCDGGTLYRTLRHIEESGFVSSYWDTEGGHARRMYSLTGSGDSYLSASIVALENYQSVLQRRMAPPGLHAPSAEL